ncbi:hypothetical protein EVAR_89749_1 [Eumeta japonica]|uniref:Uncharacterized protein n=1 Tax=Eumeta variegata TaxID=151549 RepID=A0A4C1Y682_EUMVA|nr:hypothetical protein EVAR_89749_1 [Eumeta japonica]
MVSPPKSERDRHMKGTRPFHSDRNKLSCSKRVSLYANVLRHVFRGSARVTTEFGGVSPGVITPPPRKIRGDLIEPRGNRLSRLPPPAAVIKLGLISPEGPGGRRRGSAANGPRPSSNRRIDSWAIKITARKISWRLEINRPLLSLRTRTEPILSHSSSHSTTLAPPFPAPADKRP